MRQWLVAYWWVWLLIAVVAVVGNELVDRYAYGQRHTGGDILVAIVAVVVVFFGSYFVARRK